MENNNHLDEREVYLREVLRSRERLVRALDTAVSLLIAIRDTCGALPNPNLFPAEVLNDLQTLLKHERGQA